MKCSNFRRCDRSPGSFSGATNRPIEASFVQGAREIAITGIISAKDVNESAIGSRLYKVAVTSMHICARIFAWAWDLLVGSAAYPMQQVNFY